VTFIPDVFGYSAGLPGISRAADCPYFLTQKMSWNEVNDFPTRRSDGKESMARKLLTHFPPVDTYNGKMEVPEITRSVYNDSQNDVADDRAYLVGFGDGGGGPTREMVERGEVVNEIDALPDVEWASLADLFDELESDWDEYPVWSGELYLEKHRGTLTSQAKTKRNNRKGEIALAEAELWSSIALARTGESYPHEDLEEAWKILLFNQFHDILPGSSVTDVYADADREYESVFDAASSVRSAALDALVDRQDRADQVCLTNPLSWPWRPTPGIAAEDVDVSGTELAAVPADTDAEADQLPVQHTATGPCAEGDPDEEVLLVDAPAVPAFGATTVSIQEARGTIDNPFDVSPNHITNGHVRVSFADDGTVSIHDREHDREVLDGPGNRLVLYRDQPREYDAWDVEEDIYAVGDELPAPTTEVVESGPVRATVRQTRSFGDSELIQEISLYRDSKRVEFRTVVDWHADEKLLKTHFPVGVRAGDATYETHFGHHERSTTANTTWDQAQYEEPGGRWVSVGEPGYDVALLNDCKNGVNVDGSDISPVPVAGAELSGCDCRPRHPPVHLYARPGRGRFRGRDTGCRRTQRDGIARSPSATRRNLNGRSRSVECHRRSRQASGGRRRGARLPTLRVGRTAHRGDADVRLPDRRRRRDESYRGRRTKSVGHGRHYRPQVRAVRDTNYRRQPVARTGAPFRNRQPASG